VNPLATQQAPKSPPDKLTGLPGFDAFAARLRELLRRKRSESGPVALALFDLDGFGKFNQEHGRAAGDALIRALAEHVTGGVGPGAAASPAPGEVFRFGGDAIGVILPGMEKEEAFLLMEQVRAGFGPERTVAGENGKVTLPVGVSCGVAASPDDGEDAQDLQRKLIAALYRAKVQGPGKTCLAREEKMVTKTSHYTQGQLEGLTRLAKRLGKGEAVLLREAVDDLLRKYNA
jgi:diguanylate cyclase (GGDEF)-like protein